MPWYECPKCKAKISYPKLGGFKHTCPKPRAPEPSEEEKPKPRRSRYFKAEGVEGTK